MKEHKITLRTAALAKKLGFNIPCNSKYVINNMKKYMYTTKMKRNTTRDNVFLVPTQTILQKWLRETFKIEVYVIPLETMLFGSRDYIVRVLRKDHLTLSGNVYKTYEKALEVGLQRALLYAEEERATNFERVKDYILSN